jgi:hypothetical protein
MQPIILVDPKTWQYPPPGTSGLGADEPTTGSLVAQTIGWLTVGGVVGAALWMLGHEIVGVRRGQR